MNQHIRHFAGPEPTQKFTTIGVGGPSPYPALPQGATLDIGPEGLTLVVSLPRPSRAEIWAIRRGKLDIGMLMAGSTGVLLWRFNGENSCRPVVELESVFHIGLLQPDRRYVPSGDAGLVHSVMIIAQDERATCRALRMVSLPADVSGAVDTVVAFQANQASQPGWSRHEHEAEVEGYFRRFPSPAHAFAVTDAAARADSPLIVH
jgi:hypothetical protein